MNVAGATERGVSTIYAMTVGSADATASVMIAPDADQKYGAPGGRVSQSLGRVKRNHHALHGVGALLDKVKDLVELGREEIEGGEDTTVGPEIVPWRDGLSGELNGEEESRV